MGMPYLCLGEDKRYNINIENCYFFACFRFFIFLSRGSPDPICPYVRTPMGMPYLCRGGDKRRCSAQLSSSAFWLYRSVFGAERRSQSTSMKTVKQSVLDGTSKWSAKIAITGTLYTQLIYTPICLHLLRGTNMK